MRSKAIKPVPPALTVGTAKGVSTHLLSAQGKIKNDVQSVSWRAVGKGATKEHAFLIPVGWVADELRSLCGRTAAADNLTRRGKNGRCKSCATLAADDTRKRSAGLSEPVTDNVATGVQHGDPKAAEQRRVQEIAPISGDAAKINAEIVTALRDGDRDDAVKTARILDRRGPNAPVPEADAAPIGNRDHGVLDGVAMVQGPNFEASEGGVTDWTREVHADNLPNALKGAPMAEANPDAKRRTWVNPKTGETEPASARLDGSLRERADKTIAERVDREGFRLDTAKRSKASKRRFRKAQTTAREIRKEKRPLPEHLKTSEPNPDKAEVKRLSKIGKDLPTTGW